MTAPLPAGREWGRGGREVTWQHDELQADLLQTRLECGDIAG